MFHQNPTQNQEDKSEFLKQDNSNNNGPSNNNDIPVHLSDIKDDINSVKASAEDTFARTFKFFKS